MINSSTLAPYRLEICIDSWESVLAAAAAYEPYRKSRTYSGTQDFGHGGVLKIEMRLEMCSALGLDGLTPSLALCALTHERFPWLEQNVMIRPRSGDFCYTAKEVDQMEREIQTLKPLASGFVFGALKPSTAPAGTSAEGSVAIDLETCQRLLGESRLELRGIRELTIYRLSRDVMLKMGRATCGVRS